jgi:hopanoid-associated phosphorylase
MVFEQRLMAQIGAVVGLPIERLILGLRCGSIFGQPSDRWIAVARADGDRAEALAEAAIRQGAEALISFGIAGGLDPALGAGSIVLASEIILPDGSRIATDAAWRKRVLRQLGGLDVSERPIAGADRPIVDIGEKAALHARARAVAVDMESHGIARVAARKSLPLLVLRAIADPASRALPASATVGLASDGTVKPLATISRLLAAPGELPALVGLTADVVRALATLWRVAVALKPEAVH